MFKTDSFAIELSIGYPDGRIRYNGDIRRQIHDLVVVGQNSLKNRCNMGPPRQLCAGYNLFGHMVVEMTEAKSGEQWSRFDAVQNKDG